jgi:DNA polymerase-3 subunit epsilon
MRQVFLDTETTGLSPENGDRLVETGLRGDGQPPSDRSTTLHLYLNPQRPKGSEEAIRVHGLTDEFLADKPLFRRGGRPSSSRSCEGPRS